jgi:hypothetical protein
MKDDDIIRDYRVTKPIYLSVHISSMKGQQIVWARVTVCHFFVVPKEKKIN